jgi:tRNA nucleotidyltransferase (CCA-adding enzyme)
MKVLNSGLIKSNPEQSKHLETATTHIFDYPIDFVNLRSETYTQENRIPEIVNIFFI